MFKGCLKGVCRVFQGCFKLIFGISEECFNFDLGTCQGCCKDVSRMFHTLDVITVTKRYLHGVSGFFQGCFK